jgi:hypothetical protein
MLKLAAGLFVLLAVSNLLKPFQLLGDEVGFVLFGTRLSGTANAVAGPLFGLYLLAYSWAILTMSRVALSMGIAYAAYVTVNLFLFYYLAEKPQGAGYMVFGLVYAAVALSVSWGAVWQLLKASGDLG